MVEKAEYDLAIVGAGVVGVQAALTAASSPLNKKVCLIDAPRASGMLMNEATGEDLSLVAPTGLFSKALRDSIKTINVASLRGMGLREESVWNEIISNCVELASSNAQDIKRQLEFAGVTYIEGLAQFPDSGGTDSLSVERPDASVQVVSADKYLLATEVNPFGPVVFPLMANESLILIVSIRLDFFPNRLPLLVVESLLLNLQRSFATWELKLH